MEKERLGEGFVRPASGDSPGGEAGGVADGTCKTAVRSRRSKPIARARKLLVEVLPDVAEKLATDAKTGSISHMKLLLQLLGIEDGGLKPKQRSRREKTLEEILMEQWRKEP
jgi:hypothetical protein